MPVLVYIAYDLDSYIILVFAIPALQYTPKSAYRQQHRMLELQWQRQAAGAVARGKPPAGVGYAARCCTWCMRQGRNLCLLLTFTKLAEYFVCGWTKD